MCILIGQLNNNLKKHLHDKILHGPLFLASILQTSWYKVFMLFKIFATKTRNFASNSTILYLKSDFNLF